jgi:tetratricopeptide (TPR) repeat protein
MTLAQDIERINLTILNGDLQRAQDELTRLAPHTPAEQRTVEHFLGIIAFRQGRLMDAHRQMESALSRHGDNVNLLRDLAVCQYHLQDMVGFRHNLQRLESLVTQKADELSRQSLFECELMLGKFLEEEARILPALEFYTRALSRSQSLPQRLRALVQKARWHALYEPNSELSEYYRELISVPRNKLTSDLHIELEHSLMLIELRLIGADHAWQRVQRLGDRITEMDQRLLIFDFIEGCLTHDLEMHPAVLEKMNSFKEVDPYERFIRDSLQGALEAHTKVHELTMLATVLPWASYLRLLCLASNLEGSSGIRQELNRKIILIIRPLDARSQSLWSRRLKQALQAPEIRVEYSVRNRYVTIQGRQVDLSKKKMGMQLLEGLVKKPELTVDEAIHLLWDSSFTPEHYHRLRMGIHRLNTLINKVTGLGKIIEVDSQNVRLRPEVKIRHADHSFESELINL